MTVPHRQSLHRKLFKNHNNNGEELLCSFLNVLLSQLFKDKTFFRFFFFVCFLVVCLFFFFSFHLRHEEIPSDGCLVIIH